MPSKEVHGAEEVVANARMYETRARTTELVLVNGLPGLLGTEDGQVVAVQWFTVVEDGAITEIFILADVERLNPAEVQPAMTATSSSIAASEWPDTNSSTWGKAATMPAASGA